MNAIVAMLEEGNLDEVQAYLEELTLDERTHIGPRISSALQRRLSEVESYAGDEQEATPSIWYSSVYIYTHLLVLHPIDLQLS